MQNRQNKLNRLHKAAGQSVKNASDTRDNLHCRFSPSMHMTNYRDFEKSRKGKWKKKVYLPSKKAYNSFNERIERSWGNPATRTKALSKIYGPTSHWGRLEEEERLKLEALNHKLVESDVPVRTPLEYAKAVYDTNKIVLMVPTGVHDVLVQESNTTEIMDLLQRAKAATVLQKALRTFQKRSWERKFVKIDPQLEALVEEEKEVEKIIYHESAKKQGALTGVLSTQQSHSADEPFAGQLTGGSKRIRAGTMVSEITNSTSSPNRAKIASMNSILEHSDNPQRLVRVNTLESFDVSGPPVHRHDRFSSAHLTGMEINTVSGSVQKMKSREASLAAVKNSIALQAEQHERRRSHLEGLAHLIDAQNAGGKASPTRGVEKNFRAKRTSVISPKSRRPSSAVPLGGGRRKSVGFGWTEGGLGVDAGHQERRGSRRPSTAGPKAAYRRSMGPRTNAHKSKALVNYHAGSAVNLLRKKNEADAYEVNPNERPSRETAQTSARNIMMEVKKFEL